MYCIVLQQPISESAALAFVLFNTNMTSSKAWPGDFEPGLLSVGHWFLSSRRALEAQQSRGAVPESTGAMARPTPGKRCTVCRFHYKMRIDPREV